MFAANIRQVVGTLINVLRIALRRSAKRTDVAAECVDLHVREIRKRGWRKELRTVKPREGCAKIIDNMVADGPGVRENDLPPVVALSAGELWLRLYWVNGRGAETIVKVSGAKLVFS